MSSNGKTTGIAGCLFIIAALSLAIANARASAGQASALQSIPSPTPPAAISTVVLSLRPTAGPPDPVATEAARLTAIASAPTIPIPVETPYVPPARIVLTSNEGGSYKALRKTPPYTLELKGSLQSTTGGENCIEAYWDWGDGTRDSVTCQDKPGALYRGRHTYTRFGAYSANLVMTRTGGQGTYSDGQRVVIGSTFPGTTALHDAARWVLWGGTLGLALLLLRWLRRRRSGWARLGFWLVGLALFTYLPPFSYFPNPLGIYWSRAGGYSYDLRLPFWNGFAVASLQTDELQRALDGFVGQKGALDPFDPVQPVTGYRFLSAYLQRDPARYGNYAHVITEFTYANGARREVAIPMREDQSVLGAYRMHSSFSMGRLFTQHEEFPMTVFSWESAPVHLSTPQPLPLNPDAQRWDNFNPGDWVLAYSAEGRSPVFSPDGASFLAANGKSNDRRDLWLIKLDGSRPVRMAEDVINYAWSPDGRYILYNQAASEFPVFVKALEGGAPREVARPRVQQLPGMTQEGVWYLDGEELWIAQFDGKQKRRVTTVGEANTLTIALPSADGKRVAYIHQGGLYLRDADEQGLGAPIARVQNAAWSPDGSLLAWVDEFSSLGVVERGGKVRFKTPIGPEYTNLFYSVPQWSPDGLSLFVQTFPFAGRRIVWVNPTTSAALDLTQPRWDPLFALAPDGKYLLLTNGRGGFWRSDIIYSGGRPQTSLALPRP